MKHGYEKSGIVWVYSSKIVFFLSQLSLVDFSKILFPHCVLYGLKLFGQHSLMIFHAENVASFFHLRIVCDIFYILDFLKSALATVIFVFDFIRSPL